MPHKRVCNEGGLKRRGSRDTYENYRLGNPGLNIAATFPARQVAGLKRHVVNVVSATALRLLSLWSGAPGTPLGDSDSEPSEGSGTRHETYRQAYYETLRLVIMPTIRGYTGDNLAIAECFPPGM